MPIVEILNKWDEVYATEVKMCSEVLQRHVCRAVCHKYDNDGKCRFLFSHEIVEAKIQKSRGLASEGRRYHLSYKVEDSNMSTCQLNS